MAKPLNRKRKAAPRRILRLPDLDLAKRTVLNSLGSPDSTRAYAHAIDDFIAWDCSEPRLAFGKHVVLRCRIELESRLLAPATINVRLAAVRRLSKAARHILTVGAALPCPWCCRKQQATSFPFQRNPQLPIRTACRAWAAC